MCEQLNIFTTVRDNLQILLILFLMGILPLNFFAQNLIVKPFYKTTFNPIQTDVFVYAAGWTLNKGSLRTANNTVSPKTMYGTFYDIGIGTELYKTKLSFLRLGGAVGYKYEVFSYNSSLFKSSGIHTHWLSTDVNISCMWVEAGLKGDYFLYSKMNTNDSFEYEGVYSDCFNKMNICYYVGVNFQLTRFKMEVRLGSYLIPEFNLNRLSYYNGSKIYEDGLYMEMRFSYRIFTTGKVHNSSMVY